MKRKPKNTRRKTKEYKYKPSFQDVLDQLRQTTMTETEQKPPNFSKVNAGLNHCENWLTNRSHACSFHQLISLSKSLAHLPIDLLREHHKLILAVLLRTRSSVADIRKYTRDYTQYVLLFNNLLRLPIDFHRHINVFALISLKCIQTIESSNAYKFKMGKDHNLWKICILANKYYPNDTVVENFRSKLTPTGFQLISNKGHEFTPTTSPIQQTITSITRRVTAFPVVTEFVIGCYYLDIALPDKHLCIEIDGSHHYKGQGKYALRATDQLRDFILSTLGWATIRLPAYQCYRTQSNHMLTAYVIKQLASYNVLKPGLSEQETTLSEGIGGKGSTRNKYRPTPHRHTSFTDKCKHPTYTQPLTFFGFNASKEIIGYNARDNFTLNLVFYSSKQTCRLFFYRKPNSLEKTSPKKDETKQRRKHSGIAKGKRN